MIDGKNLDELLEEYLKNKNKHDLTMKFLRVNLVEKANHKLDLKLLDEQNKEFYKWIVEQEEFKILGENGYTIGFGLFILENVSNFYMLGNEYKKGNDGH